MSNKNINGSSIVNSTGNTNKPGNYPRVRYAEVASRPMHGCLSISLKNFNKNSKYVSPPSCSGISADYHAGQDGQDAQAGVITSYIFSPTQNSLPVNPNILNMDDVCLTTELTRKATVVSGLAPDTSVD